MKASPAIEREAFGSTRDGRAVDRYTMRNAGGLCVRFLSYGGIIQSVEAPDRQGRGANVVLGFSSLRDYEEAGANIYFGALVGRYANRIGGARFSLGGRVIELDRNDGGNSLHGGLRGFDKIVWDVTLAEPGDAACAATLYLTSPDGDQGFPGALRTRVTYSLNDQNELRIDYQAATDTLTVVNLTNHSYFNLAGDGSGDVAGQFLRIDAEAVTALDASLIPTGELMPVAGTPLDFRELMPIGGRLRDAHPQMLLARGYDHNFVLTKTRPGDLSFAARAYDPTSGRVLDCFTTEPGVQVYTSNFLDGSVVGAAGRAYRQGDGFTLETQHFADSPNQPGFPSTELRPGETFQSTTIFRFATDAALPSVLRRHRAAP